MNVPNEQWVLCTANKDYEVCFQLNIQIISATNKSLNTSWRGLLVDTTTIFLFQKGNNLVLSF